MSDSDLNAVEAQRLEALRALQILDTSPETAFDDLTRLARHVCATPMALVSLVDERRQWFKAEAGLGMRETGLDVSFCAHAIRLTDMLVVSDLAADPRFRDNPLVTGSPHLRFYAGVPLRTSGGFAVGTLCVLDREPRRLEAVQTDMLRVIARQVTALLELRRISAAHAELLLERERAALAMASRLHDLQHRFKNNLQTIDSLISLQSRREPSAQGKDALIRLRDRLRPLSLIQDRMPSGDGEAVDLRAYLHDVIHGVTELYRGRGVHAELDEKLVALELPRERALPIGMIVSEFLGNSFKHAFGAGKGSRASIELRIQADGRASLRLADNGPGFPLTPGLPASGLGLQLIAVLGGQAGATPSWDNSAGISLTLDFSTA